MACNNFSNNTQPRVIFSGSLSPEFCHVDWPTTFTAFMDALTGVLPDNYSTFFVSDTEPGPADRDKIWIAVDPDTCRPIGIKLYLNGVWVDIGARVFYGTDTSTLQNLLLVTSTTPVVNWQQEGHLFLIKASRSNLGPATITIRQNGIDIYTGKAIKKFGAAPLVGLEYLAGQVVALVWDGTNFQFLNPRIDGLTGGGPGPGTGTSTGLNLSFEDDVDSDGIPDQWEVFTGQNDYLPTGTDGTGDFTPPSGGTFALDSTDSEHGIRSAKFLVTSGSGAGGGAIQTKGFIECDAGLPVELSWFTKSSAENIPCSLEILWYTGKTGDGAEYISKTAALVIAGTAVDWRRVAAGATAPINAKYFKIRFVAGTINTVVGGTVSVDDFFIGHPAATYRFIYAVAGKYAFTQTQGPIQFRSYRVTCIGGGAGGGGGGRNWPGGGAGAPQVGGSGGGGGGTAITYIHRNNGSDALFLQVGTGGAGAPDIQNQVAFDGNVSKLGTDINITTNLVIGDSGKGGMTGSNSGPNNGGAGGLTNVGQITYVGLSGGTDTSGFGVTAVDGYAAGLFGGGGGTSMGTGGRGIADANGGDAPGATLGSYGGGGGGASETGDAGAYTGGAGASGVVIIETFD